jgi:Domain of unknown function (DUF4062)
MKVFISSVVRGFEDYRAAAVEATEGVLRHEAILAERYPAMTGSPQQACLQGVRDADVTVVLLGVRYGDIQPSGMSATHEELLEARSRGVAIVLIQDEVKVEARQLDLIAETKKWTGSLIESFRTPADLRDATVRALARFEVSRSARRVDEEALLRKATEMIPATASGVSPAIAVAVVAGPEAQLIRPAELDAFGEELRREVLTGPDALFDPSVGTQLDVRDDRVVVTQREGQALVVVDAAGSFVAMLPALRTRGLGSGVLAILEEDVSEQIQLILKLATRILDRADAVQRSQDVVVVAGLVGGSWLPWRTRAEHAANPNQAAMGRGAFSGGHETVLVHLTPPRRPRGDLRHGAASIAGDLVALLRRRVRA